MKSNKPIVIYSEPVREIMGRPPGKLLRYGSAALLAVFILFVFFAWLIRYPDAIPSPVEITTKNPPVPLVSKITGHILTLNVKDKEPVKNGQLLAIMETTANPSQISELTALLDTITRPEYSSDGRLPLFTQLGEVQGHYATFIRNLTDYCDYIRNDYYGNKIKSLSEEIKSIREYIDRLIVKERLFAENQRIEKRSYSRDSILYAGKVIAESELEKSHQALIRVSIDLQQARLDHSSKSIELEEKRQQLQDFELTRLQETNKLITTLHESFLNLKAQTALWRNTYLLVSPIDGTVSFTKFWNNNQSVIKDEPVMTVVPLQPGEYLARTSLKMNRSGKVKEGMKVNIKLSGYPYLEYGMLRGRVVSKSLVPAGDTYIIDIELPDGLTTLYGDKLEFTQNMQGTAEIITENISLLQKIVNPFRYIVSRNRR